MPVLSQRRFVLLLLAALALRLLLQGWDSGLLSPHPDERQVAFVAEEQASWFADPGFYAYGSLHFQAVRTVTAVLGYPLSYGGLLVGGRVLSLGASMALLLLAWWMASEAWGRRTADLVLLLGAFVPLDLQLSHFATVETHHAAWVMACLAACFWMAQAGRPIAAVLVGLCWGASLAVKISSLPLVLPVILALVVIVQRRGWPATAACAAVATTTAGLAFILCQPSAVEAAWPLLRADYLRGVSEQIAMVTGRSDLPYVRVYEHTTTFLYPARELALWGLGPLLAAAALFGVVMGLVRLAGRLRRGRRWNDATVLLALMLAWLVPMAVRLATLEVKFLRYWQPVVMPMVMVAAWALLRGTRRWRRPAVVLCAAGTVVWGLAFVWGFAEPHPHRTAAEWLNSMLDHGQVVAVEHWDETLRLSSPGGSAETVTLESYDLPDNEAKARRWVRTLARADWVVLSSHRIRRTVFANPERYPLTGNLYRLLLAGEAGFEPLTRAARGPRFFGLEWPVQRADESFVNYDFPMVVILRRTQPINMEALVERALAPVSDHGRLWDDDSCRRLVHTLPKISSSPGPWRQVLDGLVWATFFLGLAAAAWAVLAPVLRGWADAGAGLAAVTAWLAPAWLLWLGSEVGLWPVSAATATWIALAICAVGGLVGWRRRQMLRMLWRSRRRRIRAVLAVFAALWLLFLVVRLFDPAVYWGEKPMDFSFLNAFLNADQWPPGEPWMAGKSLNYYYFCDVLAAFPILVCGSSAAVGYNLVVSAVPALSGALLMGLGLTVARRRRSAWALAFPGMVLLTGNLAWPFLLRLARDHRWFDLWWATSRVIPGFAIEEYPLWTAIFADLHAHFVALPVMIAALMWGWTAVEAKGRVWMVAGGFCGLSAGVLAATNPWDILLLSAALGVVTLAVATRPLLGLARLAAAAAVSVLAAAPYLFELHSWLGGATGGAGFFFNTGEFAPAWAIARHFGLFLIPLAAFALCQVGRDIFYAAPVAAFAVFIGLRFNSPAAALALALAALFLVVYGRARDRLLRLSWALAGLAVLAVAFCERFTLMDRMNTIFKIYNGAWLLLAVALGLALVRGRGWQRRVLLWTWVPLQLVAAVNLPLGIAQGWLQPRVDSPRPTLDGQAFLARHDPQTAWLNSALRAMARPGQAVAEAAGDPYRDFTRIAMHTGLPTVVGWEHHLFQRGQSRVEIANRVTDLAVLYGERDRGQRRAILDRHGVRWAVVADIERQAYGFTDEAELDEIPGVVRIAGRGGAAVYRVLPH